jgi:hypothetical protein
MATAEYHFNTMQISKSEMLLVVKLKRVREFRVRVWLASYLIRLALWVLPVHSRLETEIKGK